MENKKIIGNTYPLKGLFLLQNEVSIYGIEKVINNTGTFLRAKGYCYRGSHSNFVLEWFLGQRDITEENIKNFENIINLGGIIAGKKIIKYNDLIKIRFKPADDKEKELFEQDTNKREIVLIKGEDGKDVLASHKKHNYFFEGQGLIAWDMVRCCSRTCMHWTDYFLIIRYINKQCKLKAEEFYTTCRGNSYHTIKEKTCEIIEES